MKQKCLVNIIGLSVFICISLFFGLSYASEDKVSGEILNGYRILNLTVGKEIQKFVAYRGDYIKFRLPNGSGGSGESTKPVAVFPTLKEKKEISYNLDKTAYFKMKLTGVHPFSVGFMQGEIQVIEYSQPSYTVLSAKKADAYIKKNDPLILDVRTPREYKMGHLENSVLIPVQQLQTRINELDVNKNNPILIYCATGNRSTVASKILIDSGFTKILNLKRGIVDWAGKRYPIVR